EIFLKVFRSLNTYKPESGPLITWMVRVGRNHLIDQYRKFKTERTLTDSLEPEYEKAAENPPRYASPMESLEQQELSERIHRTQMDSHFQSCMACAELISTMKSVLVWAGDFPAYQAPSWLPVRIVANTPRVARESWLDTVRLGWRWLIEPRTAMAIFTATLVLGWLGGLAGISPNWGAIVRDPSSI